MTEREFEATAANIESVTDFVNEFLEALDCPLKAQMQIDVAIDELFGNIARYAYCPETGYATVKLKAESNPTVVEITFIDSGAEFNPLTAKEPDISKSADEREIGGLGIFMVKKTMDSLSYEYKDNKNILTIRKTL